MVVEMRKRRRKQGLAPERSEGACPPFRGSGRRCPEKGDRHPAARFARKERGRTGPGASPRFPPLCAMHKETAPGRRTFELRVGQGRCHPPPFPWADENASAIYVTDSADFCCAARAMAKASFLFEKR